MSNSVVSPTSQPDQVGLEARDQALLADDQRDPVGRAALERLAVRVPWKRDDRVVALLGRAVLDRGEAGVLVPQLLDDLVDLGVVDGLDLGREVEVLVVAEITSGRIWTVALKTSGWPSSAWTTSMSGLASGSDPELEDGLAIAVLDEVLDGLVHHGAGAEGALEHDAGRLARPESGHLRAAGERLTESSTARVRRSGGSSTSTATELRGAAVTVSFIVREVYGPRRRGSGVRPVRDWAPGGRPLARVTPAPARPPLPQAPSPRRSNRLDVIRATRGSTGVCQFRIPPIAVQIEGPGPLERARQRPPWLRTPPCRPSRYGRPGPAAPQDRRCPRCTGMTGPWAMIWVPAGARAGTNESYSWPTRLTNRSPARRPGAFVDPVVRVRHDPVGGSLDDVAVHLADERGFGLADRGLAPAAGGQRGLSRRSVDRGSRTCSRRSGVAGPSGPSSSRTCQ